MLAGREEIMKKVVSKEMNFCDVCTGESNQWDVCQSCGKNICHKCKPANAKEYGHSVYCSVSGAGLYCLECDQRLTKAGNKKHRAYKLIESLRNENRGFNEEFQKRATEAESELKSFG